MDLKSWAPLSYVNQSILDKVRLAYVFGSKGHDALLVTKEDEVWACGSNQFGVLGIEHKKPSLEPTIVTKLQARGVKGFSFGFNPTYTFIVAHTYSGKVYAWGGRMNYSKYRLHGRDTNMIRPSLVEVHQPSLVLFPSEQMKISTVACGTTHSLALSMDGEVYSWGENDVGQLGNGSTASSSTPVKVESHLKNQRIVKISCGDNFSIVLLDNGKIYAWGDNKNGQISSKSDFAFSSSPVRICLLNEVIIDLVCGKAYTLFLTNVGVVYGWGKNDCGELGLGDYESRSIPEMIQTIEKFVDIAAVCPCSISAAMNDKFEVFMWGDFSDYNIVVPMKTTYKSLQEVFVHFASPRIMYKPWVCQPQSKSTVVFSETKLHDVATSDLTIIAQGKKIHVHRVVLSSRSDYFRTFLQNHWVENEQRDLEMKLQYEVIHSYLQYIYTGEVKINPEFAPELLRLADEYQDLTFKGLCEELLEFDFRIDTAADLFALAFKLNATKLLEKCVTFAGCHMSEVLLTPAVSNWDTDTYKEFFTQCQKKKLFRS